MKKHILICCFSLCMILSMHAQQNYSVTHIPDSLLKGANAIKRFEEINLDIKNKSTVLVSHKYAFTVLNESGSEQAQFFEWYDKMRDIISVEGSLYDATGKLVKKLKPKEIQDLSGVDDISLIDDTRRKVHNFYYKVYPYTIEYSVVIKQNHSFYFPSWITQEDEHIAVEKTSYTVMCPTDYEVRYKALNYKGEPEVKTVKNQKMYSWQLANKPAVRSEAYSPRWHELTTMVSVAPTSFEIQGYSGNMSSWKEFGKFLYELKKGRDVLPEPIKQKVQQLTSGVTDAKTKVKLLYEYLQKNTRYISIQLGIGGWQPFDATSVATKGYGDCKALTNYMYSLLKEASINSHYAVIKAGPRDYFLMEDFPSNQFNHVVLCVPLQTDTMWLECTSQTDPAGYMGDFTGNRKALIIDEQGGFLVSTPRYALNDNLQIRVTSGKVQDNGTLNALIKSTYTGLQQDNLQRMINSLSKDKIKEVLQKELDFATYRVNDFSYNEKKSEHPEVLEHLDLEVSNYASLTGKRLFITPNLLNRSNTKLSNESERQTDIHFTFEYKDIDTVLLDIPQGYKPESIPQPVSLNTKFGTYTTTLKLENNRLTYIRIREQFAGRYPAKDYKELSDFYDRIYKADRSRIVFVKNTE